MCSPPSKMSIITIPIFTDEKTDIQAIIELAQGHTVSGGAWILTRKACLQSSGLNQDANANIPSHCLCNDMCNEIHYFATVF